MTLNSRMEAQFTSKPRQRHVVHDITIESLILQGANLPPSDVQVFQSALEAELSMRLKAPDAHKDLARNSIMGPLTLYLKSTDTPELIAHAVANSLFRETVESYL